MSDGVKQWCQVERFICSHCKKTFTRLPPYLLPFKHYIASEIEGVLRHLLGGGTYDRSPSLAEVSTIKRWWKEFSHKLLQWAALLEALIYTFSQQSAHLTNHFDLLKRLEEALAKLPALPTRWPVMVKTFWWLSTSHPL
jgi:hypothetical protein